MSFSPYFVCALLGVDSLRGGLAKGNRISGRSLWAFLVEGISGLVNDCNPVDTQCHPTVRCPEVAAVPPVWTARKLEAVVIHF